MVKAITTTISEEYYDLAKKNNISWKFALSKGIKSILDGDRVRADIEELRQDNNNLQAKLTEVATELLILKESENKC